MEDISILRGKRLREAFEFLYSSQRVKTQKEFAKNIECSESQVSKAFAGNEKYMTERMIWRLNRNFGGIFNEKYIWDGEGTLLNKENTEIPEQEEKTSDVAEITTKFLGQLEAKDEIIDLLKNQVAIKDKEIERLHTIIEKFSPETGKKEDSKKIAGV